MRVSVSIPVLALFFESDQCRLAVRQIFYEETRQKSWSSDCQLIPGSSELLQGSVIPRSINTISNAVLSHTRRTLSPEPGNSNWDKFMDREEYKIKFEGVQGRFDWALTPRSPHSDISAVDVRIPVWKEDEMVGEDQVRKEEERRRMWSEGQSAGIDVEESSSSVGTTPRQLADSSPNSWPCVAITPTWEEDKTRREEERMREDQRRRRFLEEERARARAGTPSSSKVLQGSNRYLEEERIRREQERRREEERRIMWAQEEKVREEEARRRPSQSSIPRAGLDPGMTQGVLVAVVALEEVVHRQAWQGPPNDSRSGTGCLEEGRKESCAQSAHSAGDSRGPLEDIVHGNDQVDRGDNHAVEDERGGRVRHSSQRSPMPHFLSDRSSSDRRDGGNRVQKRRKKDKTARTQWM